MTHCPITEPPFRYLFVDQNPHIEMSVIPNDTVEQYANLVTSALKHLNENVIRVTKDPGNALSGIIPTGLLENQIDFLHVDLTRRATGVKTLNKHFAIIP